MNVINFNFESFHSFKYLLIAMLKLIVAIMSSFAGYILAT